MRSTQLLSAALFAAIISTAPAVAPAALITGTVAGDLYLQPHVSGSEGATRTYTPVFAYPPSPQFPFDYYYSQFAIKWNLEIPAELQGKGLTVTSASITLWNIKDDGGWDPDAYEIHLFDAGFLGTHGFTEETWTESDKWYEMSTYATHEPYLVDLVTGLDASKNTAATPWAVGEVDPAYTGTGLPDAFPIRFTLDVNNPTIRQTLLDDLQQGYSMFNLGATYPATQGGGVYPKLISKEGVGDASLGTVQQAPLLQIEVEEAASVSDWNLY